MKKMLKTPISYYGGKQKMASRILPLIPKHELYCEPYCGGAAILFAKPPSKIEVINDLNSEVVIFYKVVKTKFKQLQKEIRATLHSRELHRKARFIFIHPHLFTDIERAWAVWVNSVQSFSSILGSTWSCGVKSNTSEKKTQAKKLAFTKELAERLEHVQIECRDALEVIKTRDSRKSFHFIDPPYFNSDMGHYGGYTADDFEKLLVMLGKIKGKFLLSSYPSDLLAKYTKKYGWQSKSFDMQLCVPGAKKGNRRKTEVLTANYPI